MLQTPWGPAALALLLGLVLLGLVLGVVSARGLAPHRRLALMVLRVSVALVIGLMLLEPALQTRMVDRIPNLVPILVDLSGSMGLPTEHGTRLGDATSWIAGQDLDPAEHELVLQGFGEDVGPITMEELTRPPRLARATRILEALEKVAANLRGRDIGGLVLVSDGADNGVLRDRYDGGLPRELEDRLLALGVPVSTVFVGPSGEASDIAIVGVIHDDFAFVHNVVSVDVDTRVQGLDVDQVILSLTEDGVPIQSRTITVRPDIHQYRTTFEFTPATVGRHHYRVATAVLDGEAVDTNNHQDFLMNVLRDRVRVLQVAGQPSWDERFLRHLLKRNPSVDLISFFILRTATDLASIPPSELSLIPFPVQELFEKELRSFDLVILQNFDFRPFRMRRYLPRIRDFVLHGGGLLMIGGPQGFASGGYAGTPVGEILPVTLAQPGDDQQMYHLGRFTMALTRAGAAHPIMSLDPNPARNQAIWASLPELEGVNRVTGPTPGSLVLATWPEVDAPVVVVGQAGKGRTMAVLTDTTWRWTLPNAATGGDLRPYTRFWNNALRWLVQDPMQKLLRISTDREHYAPGDEVRVEVRVFDRAYEPAQGVMVHVTLSGPGTTQTIDRTTEDGRVTWEFQAGEPGLWRLLAAARIEGVDREAETIFLTGARDRETRDATPRPDILEAIARATNGEAITTSGSIQDLPLTPPRVLTVDSQASEPLWSTPALLALLIAAMALDWWLRQRWGLV